MSAITGKAVHSRSVRSNSEFARPRSPEGLAFRSVSQGVWRAETTTHFLEISLGQRPKPGAQTQYHGRLIARPSGEVVSEVLSFRYQEVQKRLVKKFHEAATRAHEKTHPLRALCTFEDFDCDGIEAKLERRRDVYLKRYGLRALSQKFEASQVDGRPTVILSVVTEEAAS